MHKFPAVAFALMVLAVAGAAEADAPATQSLFDSSRYMRVSEVRAGMKGYGLSVFSGTKIEKFDVEVVAVVKNFNPKYDAVLIRCPQPFLVNTGPIAGMSGSPVYLYDSAGKARMIGAFAYGWAFAKDCLAGVQPIEYMLSLPKNESATTEPAAASAPAASGSTSEAAGWRWSLDDAALLRWNRRARGEPAGESMAQGGIAAKVGDADIRLRPLATPLIAGGISAAMLARIAPLFEDSGLSPIQGGTAGAAQSINPAPKLEPGSVLAVPLLTGDMELTAVGTCTERIGQRIFGFGHPFFDEGAIDLPVGSGWIATVVANLQESFKLGFLSSPSGALLTDQTVGVAGVVGQKAPMIPLELRVVYDDGSVDETYHFQAARHAKLTPLIAAAAVMMSVGGDHNLPQYHTVDYDVTEEFDNGQSIHVTNSSANSDGSDMVADIAMPLMAASDNPFSSVALKKMTGTVRVSSAVRMAQILSVMVPRTKYEPGETVKAYISYQPFHAGEAILPVEMQLPADLPNGTYQLIVSDWARYLGDEHTASPFKFTAGNIKQLFSVLKDVAGVAHNAVYLRLVLEADGVAVGHTAMPHLPSSQRQVMLDSGRSDITPFVTSIVKVVPASMIMSGSAEFSIVVERQGKVEVSTPQGAKPAAGKSGTGADNGEKNRSANQ